MASKTVITYHLRNITCYAILEASTGKKYIDIYLTISWKIKQISGIFRHDKNSWISYTK